MPNIVRELVSEIYHIQQKENTSEEEKDKEVGNAILKASNKLTEQIRGE